MITDFNRLPLSDQLRVVRGAKCQKSLIEIVEMLTKVNPIIMVRANRQIKLITNVDLLT